MKPPAPTTCDHVGLYSNDADRLVRFYRRALGFRPEGERVVPSRVMRAIFGVSEACRLVKLVQESPSVQLEIFQPLGRKPDRRRAGCVGYNHWGVTVGDRAKCVRSLRRKKLHVIEVEWKGRRIFFLRDPDGNRVEIRE